LTRSNRIRVGFYIECACGGEQGLYRPPALCDVLVFSVKHLRRMTECTSRGRCSFWRDAVARVDCFWREILGLQVSTCNRKRTGLIFVSPCWDAHVTMMNHSESWDEERPARRKQSGKRFCLEMSPRLSATICCGSFAKKEEPAAHAAPAKVILRERADFNNAARSLISIIARDEALGPWPMSVNRALHRTR